VADNNKNTILIVDCDFLSMKLESDLLQANGFNVLKASCGKEALNMLKCSIPNLVILDIRLPDISGYELFNKIKQDARLANVKIIAVTAFAMKEEEQKIKSVGFDSFIAKPIDIKDFIRQIKDKVSG